jgi:hypothetical protein
MKKTVQPPTTVLYPFDEYHLPYICHKCNQWLRFSALHEKVYVVSEFQTAEILHVNHECTKDLSKGKRKKK